jgi:hypothetical protein
MPWRIFLSSLRLTVPKKFMPQHWGGQCLREDKLKLIRSFARFLRDDAA